MFRSIRLHKLALAALLLFSLTIPAHANAQSVGLNNPPTVLLTTTVPTAVFPTGSIPIKRIIFIWTAVEGATQYEFQVAQNSIILLDQVADASVCVSGTCSVMPAVDYLPGAYA